MSRTFRRPTRDFCPCKPVQLIRSQYLGQNDLIFQQGYLFNGMICLTRSRFSIFSAIIAIPKMMLLLLPLDGFFMLLVRECRLDQGTVIVAHGGARTAYCKGVGDSRADSTLQAPDSRLFNLSRVHTLVHSDAYVLAELPYSLQTHSQLPSPLVKPRALGNLIT